MLWKVDVSLSTYQTIDMKDIRSLSSSLVSTIGSVMIVIILMQLAERADWKTMGMLEMLFKFSVYPIIGLILIVLWNILTTYLFKTK